MPRVTHVHDLEIQNLQHTVIISDYDEKLRSYVPISLARRSRVCRYGAGITLSRATGCLDIGSLVSDTTGQDTVCSGI